MMSDVNRDNLIREIERDEAWLVDAMRQHPAPACPALANLKQCVRIAVDEHALAFDAPPVSASTLEAAKSAVRAELTRLDEDVVASQPRVSGWWWRHRLAVSTFAAAAAVLLMFTPGWLFTPSTVPEDVVVAVAIGGEFEDFRDALALGATDEFDAEVALLATEIDDLYDAFTLADDDDWERDVDDLDDALDGLLEELDGFEDV